MVCAILQGCTQPAFQDLLRLKLVQLHVPHRSIHQSSFRDQPDQLAVMDTHAIALGFTADKLHHSLHRRGLEVGQVHRDLGTPFDQQPEPLDIAKASRGMAYSFGNLFSN